LTLEVHDNPDSSPPWYMRVSLPYGGRVALIRPRSQMWGICLFHEPGIWSSVQHEAKTIADHLSRGRDWMWADLRDAVELIRPAAKVAGYW
jgi:hypothetical protein